MTGLMSYLHSLDTTPRPTLLDRIRAWLRGDQADVVFA